MTKQLLPVFLLLILAGFASALTVSPTGSVVSPFVVNITANETQDNLTFSIVGTNVSGTCSNCAELLQTVDLEPGNYTASATQSLGNDSSQVNATFTVESLSISILDPDATTYTSGYILVNLAANMMADSIEWRTNATYQDGCTNCSTFNTTIVLEAGNHTLTARAKKGELVKIASVDFVVDTVNVTNDTNVTNVTTNVTNVTNVTNMTNVTNVTNVTNSTNVTNVTTPPQGNETPRFTVGMNKLPQMVESGNITDHELALIIRQTKLNPGIINRLVKTGRLGNESITAIIETQKTPPGIWAKVMGFFGVHVKTAKEELAENYDLTEEQAQLLLSDADVTGKKVKEKVQEKLANAKSAKQYAPGQVKNGTNETRAVKPDVPPGEAKKAVNGTNASVRGNEAKGNDTPKNRTEKPANASGKNK
jgi:hypothetical protein